MNRVDFDSARFSNVTDELLYTYYQDDKPRIYFKDKAAEADYKLVKQKVGGKEVSFGSSTRDEMKFIVTAWSDTEPGETYLFDRKTKELTKQYRIRERLPREHMAEMTRSSLQVFGRSRDSCLSGVAERRASKEPADDHHAAWWTMGPRYVGFRFLRAVCSEPRLCRVMPNFRGSTGYGKKFLDAGNHAMGRQDAGRHHLGREVSGRARHC